jgi:tetratricopeptide (TPR) repeat protein
MRLLSRRQRARFDQLIRSRWSSLRRQWAPRIRLLLGVIAVAVLLAQLFQISRQPALRIGLAAPLCSMGLLWFNRKRLGPSAHRHRSFASRWLLFPGYLMVGAIVFTLIGAWLPLLSLAAAGAVFYLGWLLGQRCSSESWEAIAWGWALLFLACVPTRLEFDPFRRIRNGLIEAASQLLDGRQVFHLVNHTELTLIESQQTAQLDTNVLLSGYALFVLVAIVAAIRRWPAFLAAVAFALSIVCGLLLVPARMLIFGLVSSSETSPSWVSSELILQTISFLACAGLWISLVALSQFFLGAIVTRSGKDVSSNRLTRIWNGLFSATFAGLMLGKGAILPKLTSTTNKLSFNRFLANYVASRRWILGVFAAPSVVLLIGLMSSDLFRYSFESRMSNILVAYKKGLSAKIASSDLDAAKLLVERLTELAPQLSEPTFELADALVDANRVEEGKAVMRRLIARDRNQGQAHLWIAAQCLKDGAKGAENFKEAKQHLIAAINIDRTNWEAIYAYAILLASRGQHEDAAVELRDKTFANPAVELEIARLQQRLGLTTDAAIRGKRLADSLVGSTGDKDAKTSTDYLRTAEAQAISGDLPSALATLESAMLGAEGDSNVKESIVRTLLVLCQLDDPTHQSHRSEYLQRVVEIDPQHPQVVTYCAKLLYSPQSRRDETPAIISLCRKVVDDAVESPTAPAGLFLVLGTGAAMEGDFDNAKKYLQLAYEKGENSPAMLNNYAWVIAQTSDGDREFALGLVNEAIAKDRHSTDALSTRAELFVLLERPKDAIVDLERIAALTGQSPALVAQLADLYDQIGDSETAASYRRAK